MLIRLQTKEMQKEMNFEKGKKAIDILKSFGSLTATTVAAKFNGELIDLEREIGGDGEISPIDSNSPDGLHILRHSGAHLLAQAVTELYPNAKPVIGPVTEDPPGFYYDIRMEALNEGDITKIEEKMRELAHKNYKIDRRELSKNDLVELFRSNPYKVELIRENVPDGASSSVYVQGDFTDFCRGPHVPSTNYVNAFKLLSTSTAYWRGKEENDSLVRIYGTAFPTMDALKDYLRMTEEAKKRDHRKLGTELDLFVMRPEYGPAFPLYTPKGTILRNELIGFMKELNKKYGWEEIWTPHAFKTTLWQKSGHMAHYQENMFLMEIEKEQYGMKPMNCPGHILLFQRKSWSYRDLPIRFSEFGTVYRYERSGVTSGLLRVRSMTQDDGHAFVRADQIESEVGNLLDMVTEVFINTFRISEVKYKLSTRDEKNKEKYTGSTEIWERATTALKGALDKRNLNYDVKEGEAAFYGPKIDVDVRDALGRYWQLSTIQLDFFMADKDHFDLKYIDENNQPQQPIMIHRAIFGTLDRFLGVIIEHFAGSFPPWLSPVQVRVLNISEGNKAYGEEVHSNLLNRGIRAEGDFSGDTINKKIRTAHGSKIPYLIIVGDKEASEKKISVRDRKDKQKNMIDLNVFIENIEIEIKRKDPELNICK
jgi:threonyl-tRNA synthetase